MLILAPYFEIAADGQGHDKVRWVKTGNTRSYPRSFNHLTETLRLILENAYIPETISHFDEKKQEPLTGQQRDLVQDHYEGRFVFSYYDTGDWSPLVIELKGTDDQGKQMEFAANDVFGKALIRKFIKSVKAAANGIEEIKVDKANHRIEINGPSAFLILLQRLTRANPHIATTEDYLEEISKILSPEEYVERSEDGHGILERLRSNDPDDFKPLVGRREFEILSSQSLSMPTLSLIFNPPRELHMRPLFSMKDLTEIVEEEVGKSEPGKAAPKYFMH